MWPGAILATLRRPIRPRFGTRRPEAQDCGDQTMDADWLDKSSETMADGTEEAVFLDFLRRRGLKFTRSRRALLRKIFSMHDHFTADQLLDRLKREKIKASKATVYRTLAVMQECELLTSHDFGEGSLYYEHTFGHSHHDHLFCVHCKSIVEFRDDRIEQIQETISNRAGFHLLSHSLKLFGLCASCLAREELRTKYRVARSETSESATT